MNWEAFGAIGQWAGAIVVVLTLFYLAWQVRQQNAIAKYTALKDVLDGFNVPNQLLTENAELRELFMRGVLSPEALTEAEEDRFNFLFRLYYNHMLKFQRAFAAGLISENDWNDFALHFADLLFSPGGSLWLENQGTATFQDMIEAYRAIYKPGMKTYGWKMTRREKAPPSL